MQIPRLHPNTLEEVRQRADIVDVISEYVVLRKRGKDFLGLCPFHQEKTPSFTVSPTKQIYYCFGCQAGGNVITFLKQIGKRSFSEVVLDLARRYQVPVQTLEPEQRQELQRQFTLREQLYEITASATAFYQHALRQPQGKQALEYLKSQRHFSEETIQQYRLGYAPVGWETLYRYLVEQKGYSVQLVEKAGLIVPRKSGNGYLDRFRDRLMIPIQDIQGRVIAFGGRSLGDEQPKYLNSPETELFDKSKTLFCLDKAHTAISQQDCAVVVEGYFDAIALHAAGINNVVASLGTALSLNQVKQILRYSESKEIILNFDGDNAGIIAAQRAIGEISDLAYQGQVQLKILNLPGGKDADEFLRNIGNATQYQQLLNSAPLWIDWQIGQLLLGKDLKYANQFQQVNQAIVKLLSNLTNDNQLIHYINRCAEILSFSDVRKLELLTTNLINQIVRAWETRLKQDPTLQVPLLVKNRLKFSNLPKLRRSSNVNKLSKKALPVVYDLEKAESLLLRFYLHCPEHRNTIITVIEERNLQFSLSHHRFLWQRIQSLDVGVIEESPLQAESKVVPTDLISKLQDVFIDYPDRLAQVSHLFYLDELTQREIVKATELINDAAASIQRAIYEKESREFMRLWQQTDRKINLEKWEEYLREFNKLKQRIKELDQELQFLFYFRF